MIRNLKLQIAALTLTLILLVYLLYPLLPEPNTPAADIVPLLVNIVSALGTLLAVLVALYFGTDAQRQSLAIGNARASIAAARLIGRLERIGHRLDWTVQATLYKGSNDGRYRYLLMGVRGEDLSEMQLSFTDEELIGLLPLGHDCAPRIALCTTELLRIRHSLESYEQIFKDLSSDGEKTLLIKQWMDGIQAASTMLKQVQDVLNESTGKVTFGTIASAA